MGREPHQGEAPRSVDVSPKQSFVMATGTFVFIHWEIWMTTKAELRAALRRRLEDVPVTGLWDDATLDDALADGLSRYGTIAPLEERTTVVVSDGALSFTVAGLETERSDCSRARSGAGSGFAISGGGSRSAGTGMALVGRRGPAGETGAGGNWIIEWHRPRLLPASDAGLAPVNAGDEGAVTLIAAGSALRRRAVEEAKRGGRGVEGLLALAQEWEATGEHQARARGRNVRSFVATTR